MSPILINAHTGEQHAPSSATITSLDGFKTWLSEISSVATSDQILLTSTGRQAKLQALQSEPVIYLYSRRLISTSNPTKHIDLSLTQDQQQPPNPTPPPPSSSNPYQDDIQAWKGVFDARRDWARELYTSGQSLASQVATLSRAISNIQKGLEVAVGNLQAHVHILDSKHAEARDWARQTSTEQDDVLHTVRSAWEHIPHLPAKIEFLSFLPKLAQVSAAASASLSQEAETLADFVNVERIDHATGVVRKARNSVLDRVAAVEKGLKTIHADRDELVDETERVTAHSAQDDDNEAKDVLQEIEVLVKKVSADSEHVASQQSSSKNPAQISKMAQLHTKQYLPALRDYLQELEDLARKVTQDQLSTAGQSLKIMQNIGRVEASFSQTNNQLMGLDVPEEAESAFELLNVLAQLPFVYGALLIEAVRRYEWADRLRAESAELAEDIAGYRDEEDKRRKRWTKNIGHLLSHDLTGGSVLSFEVSLAGEDRSWPDVTRDDISQYLQALRELRGVDEIVEELSEAAKELDRPTKRQIKKAKGAFKSGSMHEATNMRASFLMRENDEARILREVNSRLEEDLKGQKSRVRKLEDILYKQQQRPSSSNIFGPPSGLRRDSLTPDLEPPSPRSEATLSRKASVASRRGSIAKSVDENNMVKRILDLEAALQHEKQRWIDNELRVKTEHQESQSTKKDLMENMEAQQREFADERRLLQDQVREHKLKVEEMEDEFDRVLGSRDNDKHNTDERLRDTESQLRQAKQVIVGFEQATKAKTALDAEHTSTLQNVRSALGAPVPTSTSLPELLAELEMAAQNAARRTNEFARNLESVAAERHTLQGTLDRQVHDLMMHKEKSDLLEDEVASTRSDYEAEKAKATSIATELEDARGQLKSLRSKFGDGETGSEALQSRLQEQAARAGDLTTELAQTKSHVNSLDFELSSLQRRHKKLQDDAEAITKRLEQRNGRDKELTQNLVVMQEELIRLLDALGLSAYYRDGTLAIQRTSKLASTSTSALAESTALTMIPTTADLKPHESHLQWMHAPSLEVEEKLFTDLTAKFSALDIITFSEAITKLQRNVEYTGKKWKQEARNYRDKYQRVSSESYEKIAFRSFKEGDLALFLPTRNQATRPWAAFNIGAPHYFLREQESHRLQNREWLVARISRMEERVVDLSRSLTAVKSKDRDAASIKSTGGESTASFDDDNPFELSDGLRWYLLDASEERTGLYGAPSTPGLGKTTVASVNVDAKGSVRMKKPGKDAKDRDVSTLLNKTLDTDRRDRSRRSSTSSKRASISAIPEETAEALREAGVARARPGSRSSATGPVMDPLGGLPIGSGGISPTHEKKMEHHETLARQITRPSRAQEALQLAGSPSKPPLLGLFGTSASPPKTSGWFKRSPSRTRVAASSIDAATTTPSPSKARPSASQSPSKLDQAQVQSFATPQDRMAASASSSPSRRAQAAPAQLGPPKPAAWESLWSLDFGVEEGKK